MTVERLTEGTVGSPKWWRERLFLDDWCYHELVQKRVLTYTAGVDRRKLQLRFVGFVALRDRLIVVSPRFGLTPGHEFSWLRRVLSTYFAIKTRQPLSDEIVDLHYRDESVFRELDALATLMRIYSECGLYQRRAVVSARNSGGAIDWVRTLGRGQPVISEQSLFFPDEFRRRQHSSESDVGLIQAAILIHLLEKYEMAVEPALRDRLCGHEVGDVLGLERQSYNLSVIHRERAITYQSRDLELLDVLGSFLSDGKGMSGPAGMKLHGTTSFAMVWEDALRSLFGSDHEDIELGQPLWQLRKADQWEDLEGTGEQRPDIVLRRKDELLILDAKYHQPFPQARPGWADIVKQLYYAETLVVTGGESVSNLFLLPGTGEMLRLAGKVEIAGGARGFPIIEAWIVDAHWVFSTYGERTERIALGAREVLYCRRKEVREMLHHANSLISS